MASAISKRQQARNERTLQELIKTVPGNGRCADCAANNPGWASWNLGIFLCMRCAALHRKLGTHVSKIKSLSMDSWSTVQVDNMRTIGNAAANKVLNPQNVKADIPVDVDEADAAIEKFIRLKYEQRALAGVGMSRAPIRQNTGSTSTGSVGEEPPPLPPKPGKIFGFNLRSASSTFTRPKLDRFTPPLSPAFSGSDRSVEPSSPHKISKPSQVFGMKMSISNNFDAKLASLQDMGFDDGRRNSEVLKSTNGNVDRAVEALVAMGEGSKPTSRAQTPGVGALTPVSLGSTVVNGITVDKTRPAEAIKVNSNPWEIREEQHVQRSATQPLPQSNLPPRAQTASPTSNLWNPFLQQTQPQQSLENSFQYLQVSQTGPVQSVNAQQQYPNNPFPPPASPWQIQQQPQQSFTDPAYGQHYQYQQYQQSAPVQQVDQNSNPFLRKSRSQIFTPSNPWAQQQTAQHVQQPQQAPPMQQPSNPFGTMPFQSQNLFQQPATQSPAPIYGQQSDFFSAPQQSAQQQMQQAPQVQSFSPPPQGNPWQQFELQQQIGSTQRQYPQQQQQQFAPHQQQSGQPGQYQPPPRHDKSSILALYNYPQTSPLRSLQTLPEDDTAALVSATQRSVTMPVQVMQQQQAANMNPFAQMTGQAQGVRHVSNESVDFQGMPASGRHSPDAFAGLSAQYMR